MTLTIPPESVVPLGHNRDFRLLWCGQIASELGSNSATLAVPLLVLSLTGSPGWAGLIGFLSVGVAAVGRLPGGALADRWNRRRLMLFSDAGRLMASLTLGVCLLLDRVSLLLVAVVVSVLAILDVLFSPAEVASVSRLVPADQLSAAFSGNQARTNAAVLGGRTLGGLLFGLGRAVPFLFDALSYLISLLTVAAIRTPLQAERTITERPSLIGEVRGGLRYVFASAFLRAVILIAAPLNFALNGAIFTTTVALQQAGTPPGTIGLALAAMGGSGLLGSLAAARLNRRLILPRLARLVCFSLSVAAALAAALSGNPLMAVPLALAFFLAPAINVALYARLGASTPDHLQSRVVSVIMLTATGAAALAPLACGLLITATSARVALLTCAATILASLLLALTTRGLRDNLA